MARPQHMPVPARTPAPGETPLSALLGRLAGEFGELAALASAVQDLPGRLGRLDEAGITAAQRLDVLTQRLDAIAVFTDTLARLVPGGVAINAEPAMTRLTLADQRRRLAGTEAEAEAGTDTDFELF